MPLPTDHATLCRWRMFVISRWRLDHNIWMACLQTVCLGMNMRRADFMNIVRVYVDHKDDTACNGPCSPDFDLRKWMR